MSTPEVHVQPLGQGWAKHSMSQTIQANRTGWCGVWDALVAAITRRPRLTVSQPVTMSVSVKSRPGFMTDLTLEIKQ